MKRLASDRLVVEKLPDGSTAVFETASTTVFSLNAEAAAAFEACAETRSLRELVRAMQANLHTPVSEDMALAAVSELEESGLVTCTGPRRPESERASRRALLKAAGAAIPLVLALTAAEQRLYAGLTGSGQLLARKKPAPGGPAIASVTGPVCTTGAQFLAQTINGQNTHFVNGVSRVTITTRGRGRASTTQVVASGIEVISPTQIVVNITSSTDAPIGPADVTVVTGGETATGLGVLSLLPASGCRAQ
ncbi:MAG: hypothetical protein LAP87_08155 [Acidobacteriia bacterium]|nr:hypothetical protein [Terriglobia bacterium]